MKNLNMNLPNRLTLIRIALVPLFIACFYIESPSAIYVACGIFIAAFLTDIADGYLCFLPLMRQSWPGGWIKAMKRNCCLT